MNITITAIIIIALACIYKTYTFAQTAHPDSMGIAFMWLLYAAVCIVSAIILFIIKVIT